MGWPIRAVQRHRWKTQLWIPCSPPRKWEKDAGVCPCGTGWEVSWENEVHASQAGRPASGGHLPGLWIRSRSLTDRALTTPPTWIRNPGGKQVRVKNGNSCAREPRFREGAVWHLQCKIIASWFHQNNNKNRCTKKINTLRCINMQIN